MRLPAPSPDALAFSDALKRRIIDAIEGADGWIGFDRFMELALYAPGMGYYSGGAQKFGAAGDFVTAPEISSAFSQTLATQAIQIMALSAPQIVEVGAGSGRLAADLLLELERRNALPERYAILDLSGELRARQRRICCATCRKRRPRRSCSHRPRWASCSRSSPSAKESTTRCSASRWATAARPCSCCSRAPSGGAQWRSSLTL